MNRRQFLVLFLCNLIPWWVGTGLVALLPIYAARLGASPSVVGNYLSILFLALAAGTMAGGWIAARVRRFRQLLMVLAAICALTVLLHGQAVSIWQLMLLSAATWFSAGITCSVVMILVGEFAEAGKRGYAFGLLTMATSLGGVLGGVTGFIADHWGYPWLFALASATWLAQVIIASFLINPRQRLRSRAGAQTHPEQAGLASTRSAATFLLLVVAALIFSIASHAGFLGRTLAMEMHGLPSATITLMAALGSCIGLVANPLLGRLSDRGGRRMILGILYLAGAFALAMTATSRTTLDFAIVSIILAFSAAERGISVALVSDVVPSRALSRSLSLFDSVKWFGGVIGMAATGYAVDSIGLSPVLLLSALLPVFATLLLLFLRASKARTGQVAAPQLDPA